MNGIFTVGHPREATFLFYFILFLFIYFYYFLRGSKRDVFLHVRTSFHSSIHSMQSYEKITNLMSCSFERAIHIKPDSWMEE